MTPANDKGPRRHIAAVDIRELAELFNVAEDSMRVFCIEHEAEISAQTFRSAADIVQELGLLEGLIPLQLDDAGDSPGV